MKKQKAYCKKINTILVIITTFKEQEKLMKLTQDRYKEYELTTYDFLNWWVGARKETAGKEWRWSSGEPVLTEKLKWRQGKGADSVGCLKIEGLLGFCNQTECKKTANLICELKV